MKKEREAIREQFEMIKRFNQQNEQGRYGDQRKNGNGLSELSAGEFENNTDHEKDISISKNTDKPGGQPAFPPMQSRNIQQVNVAENQKQNSLSIVKSTSNRSNPPE